MQIFIQLIISLLISYALQALNKPKITKPTAGSLDVPEPKPGALFGVTFGRNIIKSANVVWYGDATTEPIEVDNGK